MNDMASAQIEADLIRLGYRDAMAHLGAAVNIVTTDGPGGRAGFAATAVCSVTDDPPTLLVCLNRAASVYPAFKENGVLCVNTLAAAQEPIARIFGGKTPQADRFTAATWSTLRTSAPILDAALIGFDCVVEETIARGTHDILLCSVTAIARPAQGDGLVYFGRQYRTVGALSDAGCLKSPAQIL